MGGIKIRIVILGVMVDVEWRGGMQEPERLG